MRGIVKYTNPEDIELTLSLTMKASEWHALMRSQQSADEGGQFGMMLARILGEYINRPVVSHDIGPYFMRPSDGGPLAECDIKTSATG